MPTPTACPLIAAMTGLRTSYGQHSRSLVATATELAARQVGTRAERPSGAGDDDRPHLVVGVRRAIASPSSAPSSVVHAFSLSGRLSVTVATPSLTSYSTVS